MGLVKHLLENHLDAVTPSLTLRDVDGAIPLHSAILKGFAPLVELLVKFGPPDTLYLENGVGATPLEMAALAHLTSTVRSGTVQTNHSRISVWSGSTINLDPSPSYKASDEGEIKGLRKIVDNLKTTNALANKPALVQALSNYADISEEGFARWKAEQEAEREAEEKSQPEKDVNPLNESTVRDTAKTFEIFSKAVVRVHQRTLVHLQDVQRVVLSGVERSVFVKAKEEDEGLESENEEATEAGQGLLANYHWAQGKDEI